VSGRRVNMQPQLAANASSSALPVAIVVACTAIVCLGIAAWLVREVALRAIDRSSPEKVAAVVQALGSILRALGVFLPWSGRDTVGPPRIESVEHGETAQNEKSPAAQGDQR
jgi:hypothetical protein